MAAISAFEVVLIVKAKIGSELGNQYDCMPPYMPVQPNQLLGPLCDT